MIKGWKNNPLWVKHYQEVKEARAKVKHDRFIAEYKLNQMCEEIEQQMQRADNLKKQPPCFIIN